jgi:septum formation protein
VKLLLASGSATRRRMLEDAGVPFDVVRPELDEEALKRELVAAETPPAHIAERLAALKAGSAAPEPGTLVLGSDQTLEQDNGIMLSKPGSRAEAHEQLRALSDRAHYLHSAAVLMQGGEVIWQVTTTNGMEMRPLSDRFISAYLDAEYEAVRHNVGCYRIEGLGAQLFARTSGSHFSILGLPLLPLLGALRQRGVLAA